MSDVSSLGVLFLDVPTLAIDAAKYLILEQNKRQSVFDFSVFDQPETDGSPVPTAAATALSDRQLYARADAAIKVLREEARSFASYADPALPKAWLVITEAPIQNEFYVIGKAHLTILSLAQWHQWSAPPSVLEFILNVTLATAIETIYPGKKTHYPTKGCLFDFNANLPDAKFTVLVGVLCGVCRAELSAHKGIDVLGAIDTLSARSWLGAEANPMDPASIVKRRFGYSLYMVKGLAPNPGVVLWNKFTESIASEFGKQIVAGLVGGGLVSAVLIAIAHFGIKINTH